MNQSEFRKITGEVALYIDDTNSFLCIKCLTAQRAKNALAKLNNSGFDAKILVDKKLIFLNLITN